MQIRIHRPGGIVNKNKLFTVSGEEQGMLEDMTVVIQELRTVSFQVCALCNGVS